MEYPFFILGNPRSGTSLFRLMLNSHPNIVVPPESGFLQWWYEKYKNWNFSDSLNNERVRSYIEDLLSSKKIEDWSLDPELIITNINIFLPKNYSELSALVYLSYKNTPDILKIGDKNNYYIQHLSLINKIYPNTKYIHLVRDGRDVACSYKKIKTLKTESLYKPHLVSDIEEIALEWRNNVKKINFFLVEKPNLKIRYEDLLLDTKNTLSKVCDFLEISYHSQMLNYYKTGFNDEPLSTIDWKMKTLEPLDISNIKKYLDFFDKKEIEIFNRYCLDELSANGYEI